MNKVIDSIKDHRSIRQYKEEQVSEEMLNEIIESAQAMPNSINGQQTSVVVVRDQETRSKIAELAGGQPWIAAAPVFLLFVSDFYKTDLAAKKNGLEQAIHTSIEGTLVGAVDVGLNMAGAMIAAESLGLGTVPIGGIRKSPKAMIELLGLPEKTFPLAGLTIGHPENRSHKKPRLPMTTYRHDESYKTEGLEEEINNYDDMMEGYLKDIDREVEGNWSKNTSGIYQYVYFPDVYPVMKDQGFSNNK